MLHFLLEMLKLVGFYEANHYNLHPGSVRKRLATYRQNFNVEVGYLYTNEYISSMNFPARDEDGATRMAVSNNNF